MDRESEDGLVHGAGGAVSACWVRGEVWLLVLLVSNSPLSSPSSQGRLVLRKRGLRFAGAAAVGARHVQRFQRLLHRVGDRHRLARHRPLLVVLVHGSRRPPDRHFAGVLGKRGEPDPRLLLRVTALLVTAGQGGRVGGRLAVQVTARQFHVHQWVGFASCKWGRGGGG